MKKAFACLWLMAVLVGCNTTANHSEVDIEKNEAILKTTNDPQGLVDFYKAELAKQDGPRERYKLAEAYLGIDDAESALFYMQPLIEEERLSATGYYLYGRALAMQGEYLKARHAILEAIVREEAMAEAHNFLGVLDAEQGRFDDARSAFNQARALLFDDVTIKNNLAVLDIYQQDYESALNRLLPLWSNGLGDDRIRANMLLAMAKLGRYDDFRALVGSDREEFAVIDLYQALATSQPRSDGDGQE
ncbi:hypothetical protein [Thaumasiovibrio subtropicus]|uniref:hypothetical protein n=1 Tax=Thaumasiovibrio subtropicus TaxID=1891207 RepID=UPI000B34D335|nr:hypothetical protein [Thaumasiovibrio subtropicus]